MSNFHGVKKSPNPITLIWKHQSVLKSYRDLAAIVEMKRRKPPRKFRQHEGDKKAKTWEATLPLGAAPSGRSRAWCGTPGLHRRCPFAYLKLPLENPKYPIKNPRKVLAAVIVNPRPGGF